MKKLIEFTTYLVQKRVKPAIDENNSLTIDQYYEMIRPEWEGFVTSNIKLIPHTTELFPMPARVDYVIKRINFTPQWVGAYLQNNGIKLKTNENQRGQVDEILARFPRKNKAH